MVDSQSTKNNELFLCFYKDSFFCPTKQSFERQQVATDQGILPNQAYYFESFKKAGLLDLQGNSVHVGWHGLPFTYSQEEGVVFEHPASFDNFLKNFGHVVVRHSHYASILLQFCQETCAAIPDVMLIHERDQVLTIIHQEQNRIVAVAQHEVRSKEDIAYYVLLQLEQGRINGIPLFGLGSLVDGEYKGALDPLFLRFSSELLHYSQSDSSINLAYPETICV